MVLPHFTHHQERSQPPQGHEAFENRFLAMMQESADVFWYLSPEGSMQEVGPSWHTFTGQEKSRGLGRGWLDALHPADQLRVETLLQQTVTRGVTADMDCHLRRADRTYRLIHVRTIPVRLSDGAISEVIVCGTDITNQERAGQMSEAEVQLALKGSGVGMWDWDLVTNQVNWTEQGKALLGVAPTVPVDYDRFLATLHPEDREPVDRFLARAVAERADYQTEYRVCWPDGSVHWISDRGHCISDTHGHPTHMVGAVISITDLKRAEESLQEASHQITTILESITDGVVHLDEHWRVTYMNRRAEAYAGVNREAFLGQCIWEAAPYFLGTAIEQQLREAMQRRQVRDFDAPAPRRQCWFEIHVYPTSDGLSLYFHDITERKHAEEALQEAHQRITAILESITDAFSHVDTEWRYTYVNRGLEQLMGKNREEIVGHSLWDMIPEVLGTPFEDAYRQAMETQQTRYIEGFHPTFLRWLEIFIYPTPDGLSFYLHDITERKQAEEALRESEARFRALVGSNLLGVAVIDLQEETVREANDAFLALSGYTRGDLAAGRIRLDALSPPEYQEQRTKAKEALLTTGTLRVFEKEYLRKDGTRVPAQVGGILLTREGAEPAVLCFVLDLTARKEVERHKDLILSMTSHELKTPLAALKGTLQLTQRRLKRAVVIEHAPPEWRGFFQDLTKSLRDAVRQVDVQTLLINDLLDVSQIMAGTLKLELEICDLASLVRETVEDLRVIAPERALILEVPEHPAVMVRADRARICQVITNYVTNAIRYSPPEQPVQIGLTCQEDVARVWVRDQGPGLSQEAQKELWQRFHQIKGVPVQSGSGKGLGLGLYICLTLITQHRGEVGVDSTLGEGSTFWFTLPLCHTEEFTRGDESDAPTNL